MDGPCRIQTPAGVALTEERKFRRKELRVKAGAPFGLVITKRDQAAHEFEVRQLSDRAVHPPGATVRLWMPARKPGI